MPVTPPPRTSPLCPPGHRQVIDITWPVSEGKAGMVGALSRIATEAAEAIDDGFDFVVLSDRNAGGWAGGRVHAIGWLQQQQQQAGRGGRSSRGHAQGRRSWRSAGASPPLLCWRSPDLCPSPRTAAAGRDRVAVSSLMAVGHVHHHLVTLQKRSRVGLLLESAEAREVSRGAWRARGVVVAWLGGMRHMYGQGTLRSVVHSPHRTPCPSHTHCLPPPHPHDPHTHPGAPLLPAPGLRRGRCDTLPGL